MAVKLIVGLGNPGEEYEGTRHNAGFLVLDRVADELGARYWKNEAGALTAHDKRDGGELVLAKPQSYMNTSGGPVSKLAAQYRVKPAEILVIHDDLDLPPGTIRIKVGGGHGGHNGLKSINAKLGSTDYLRVKIGTGHPSGRKTVVDYVLQAPRGEQAEFFEQAISKGTEAALDLLEESPQKAMNRFN